MFVEFVNSSVATQALPLYDQSYVISISAGHQYIECRIIGSNEQGVVNLTGFHSWGKYYYF